MKKNKQDMSVRELFRQKLGDAEAIPDASVGVNLMKAQARKEFLRFNPARFNIYYVGAILVTVITSIIIISKGKTSSESNPLFNAPTEIGLPVIKENTKNIVISSEVQNPDTVTKSPVTVMKTKPALRLKAVTKKIPFQKSDLPENNIVSITAVNESQSKKVLLTGSSPEMNKLQAGLKTADVLFGASATEGCAPLNLSFNSKTNTSDSCRWTFGDGGYSTEKNPKWIFDIEGDYKVVLNVFSSDSIKATSSITITVYPKPQARFEIFPDNAILPKDEIHFYNYTTNAIHFDWDFGDGNSSELFEPMHKYYKSGNYNVRLVVTSDYGCTDSITVRNAYSGSEFFINFPNAFIPNAQGPTGGYYSAKSDEASQVFHPVFSGVSDYQLKIFSRLGILIFESNDINIGWDGYFKGQFSEPGVYIWKVRGNFRNGEPFIKTGDVTLFRY
ncbi:MAG TPA: PKD domain-containing protein [Bacteroidales bacterium]